MTRYFFISWTVLLSVITTALIGCTKGCQERQSKDVSISTNSEPELSIEDLKVGDGQKVERSKEIQVHFKAWLYDPAMPDKKGKLVDDSKARNQVLEFVIGEGTVISGWEDGLLGMREHGVRRLTVPSTQAYGEAGAGEQIPGNSSLVYEVELLEVTADGK